MKTTIIYLGFFALTVFTTCNAENEVSKELLSQNQQITNLFLLLAIEVFIEGAPSGSTPIILVL